MDSLCLCWRGNPGTGKRKQLLQHLQLVAKSRGLPFSLHSKFLQIGSASSSSTGEVDENDDTSGERTTEQGEFAYESSLVHVGFDVSRMSMQDKNILRPVFLKLGQGSQVLAGQQGRGSRILVLYHAHLLSTESILLLQSALEQNNGDLSVWITSEIPVPLRIRDWFVEVPVKGEDQSFANYAGSDKKLANWPDIFLRLFTHWRTSGHPKLEDVAKTKQFVYEMLMRNLRWTECIHFVMDVIVEIPGLSHTQRRKALEILADCEGTGGGQTLPSYRIPILWEGLFLQLRSALCIDEGAGANTSSTPATSRKRKKAVAKSA
jgi:hypothetical protein